MTHRTEVTRNLTHWLYLQLSNWMEWPNFEYRLIFYTVLGKVIVWLIEVYLIDTGDTVLMGFSPQENSSDKQTD